MSKVNISRKPANPVTPDIAVLMSTYNGGRFLREQLDSILNQSGVKVRLFVRDDGSTDNTPAILKDYADLHQNISIEFGTNIGVVASFLKLLSDAGGEFNAYAFADQDDVWKPEKLIRAFSTFKSEKTPEMYYGRLQFVDENLEHLGYSAVPHHTGFHNALVQNQATGCTVMVNRSARNLIVSTLPKWALMHDWWCYLVVSAFGNVYYDRDAHILYRNHGSNVTPATPNFLMELYARTRRFLGENDIPEKVTDQARHFGELFGESLDSVKSAILNGFLDARRKKIFGRFAYVFKMPVRRNTHLDTFLLRILIVIGRF